MKVPEEYGFESWVTLAKSLKLTDLDLIDDSLIVDKNLTLRELKILVLKEINEWSLDEDLINRIYFACQAVNVAKPNETLFTREEMIKIISILKGLYFKL